jgi:hypothetical protein
MALRTMLFLLVLVAPSLRAQGLLPAHFGPWTSNAAVQAAPENLAVKAVLAESGLDKTEARAYSSGAAAVNVTLYQFHDSSGAYEAYTYFVNPKGVGAGDDTRRYTLAGNIVLSVGGSDALASDDQQSLSRLVSAKADKTPPPPIPNYLPARDRIAGTEKYALGPEAFRAALASLGRPEYAGITEAAGFSSGAEAMFARYRTTRDDAVLLLIEFPTPQLAGLHWKHLEQALPASARQNGTSIERKGSLLAIVLSPSSASYAARVREAVNYETQVTWNEPTHTITDPPITSVLAKIIMATGAFMLVAIVFGVAFGGVRVLMKSLFPGKIFDRPEQMDVLQLGLSGKRINSRDFY